MSRARHASRVPVVASGLDSVRQLLTDLAETVDTAEATGTMCPGRCVRPPAPPRRHRPGADRRCGCPVGGCRSRCQAAGREVVCDTALLVPRICSCPGSARGRRVSRPPLSADHRARLEAGVVQLITTPVVARARRSPLRVQFVASSAPDGRGFGPAETGEDGAHLRRAGTSSSTPSRSCRRPRGVVVVTSDNEDRGAERTALTRRWGCGASSTPVGGRGDARLRGSPKPPRRGRCCPDDVARGRAHGAAEDSRSSIGPPDRPVLRIGPLPILGGRRQRWQSVTKGQWLSVAGGPLPAARCRRPVAGGVVVTDELVRGDGVKFRLSAGDRGRPSPPDRPPPSVRAPLRVLVQLGREGHRELPSSHTKRTPGVAWNRGPAPSVYKA